MYKTMQTPACADAQPNGENTLPKCYHGLHQETAYALRPRKPLTLYQVLNEKQTPKRSTPASTQLALVQMLAPELVETQAE